jgi:hypothetical protein
MLPKGLLEVEMDQVGGSSRLLLRESPLGLLGLCSGIPSISLSNKYLYQGNLFLKKRLSGEVIKERVVLADFEPYFREGICRAVFHSNPLRLLQRS